MPGAVVQVPAHEARQKAQLHQLAAQGLVRNLAGLVLPAYWQGWFHAPAAYQGRIVLPSSGFEWSNLSTR